MLGIGRLYAFRKFDFVSDTGGTSVTLDMQWMISFEEEVEALEEVKEWREILLEMAETEARGREGVVELEIFADWPSAGKEREAIAAAISSRKKKVGRERERGEFCYWDLGRGEEDGLAMGKREDQWIFCEEVV